MKPENLIIWLIYLIKEHCVPMTVTIRMSKKKHKKLLVYTDTDFLLVFVFIEEIMRRKKKKQNIQDIV